MNISLFFVATILVFFDGPKSCDDLAKQIIQLAEEELFSKGRSFYRTLFKTATSEDSLQDLLTHEESSIALQTAWEIVTASISKIPENEGKKDLVFAAGKLSWFLGFFEGRARIATPGWWKNSVLNSRILSQSNIAAGAPIKEYKHYTVNDNVFYCPEGSFVDLAQDQLQFVSGNEAVLLPQNFNYRLFPSVVGFFNGSYCFLTFHSDGGYPHPVCCIEKTTNKLIWSSKVCGSWWTDSFGPSRSYVSVVCQKNLVYVFGNRSRVGAVKS